MKKRKLFSLTLLLASLLFLSGCGDEDEENITTTAQGWHNQGRDCLACHNVDLNPDKHLLYGGTLYKSANVPDQNDLNNMCGGDLVVNLFNTTTGNLDYSSNDYNASGSKGYLGKGNIFILQRELRLLSAGSYNIQITTQNGTQLAIGGGHTFSSQDYDIAKPVDYGNRLSCNSCHSNSGPQAPLYVEINSNLCQ